LIKKAKIGKNCDILSLSKTSKISPDGFFVENSIYKIMQTKTGFRFDGGCFDKKI
jgi:hypothetical protein